MEIIPIIIEFDVRLKERYFRIGLDILALDNCGVFEASLFAFRIGSDISWVQFLFRRPKIWD